MVQQLMKEQPDYLNSVECPYGQMEMELLRKLSGPPGATATADTETRSDNFEDLDIEAETLRTLKDLISHEPDYTDATAVQGYFRTKTALLGKLHELKDRAKNQKSIGEFYGAVLGILDDLCSPGQKAEFRERLKEFSKK